MKKVIRIMTASIYIIPAFIFIIMVACFKNKINVYESVLSGAETGLKTLITILPTMIIILSAVSMLRASGVLDCVVGLLSPLFYKVKLPPEIIPMMLLRPVSGSGSFGLLSDYLLQYGPDSLIGRLTSVIMGSTETTFYTIAVYFAGTGIKDVKKVIPCALFADFVSMILACIIIK